MLSMYNTIKEKLTSHPMLKLQTF